MFCTIRRQNCLGTSSVMRTVILEYTPSSTLRMEACVTAPDEADRVNKVVKKCEKSIVESRVYQSSKASPHSFKHDVLSHMDGLGKKALSSPFIHECFDA